MRSSTYYHGKRVSRAHKIMLEAYEQEHGLVFLNQGRRTLAEQARFYAIYLRYGHPLAAKPLPGAPHIKWGRANHALDISAGTNAGYSQNVAAFYRAHGIQVAFNVATEAWHMDTFNEAELIRAAKRLAGPPVLKVGSRGKSVIRLKRLLYKNGLRNFTSARSSNRFDPRFNVHTEAAVKRFQRRYEHLKADGVVGPATWKALGK